MCATYTEVFMVLLQLNFLEIINILRSSKFQIFAFLKLVNSYFFLKTINYPIVFKVVLSQLLKFTIAIPNTQKMTHCMLCI